MEHVDQFAAPGYPIFLGSEIEQPQPESARFHILPAPYERSVSYGAGTAKGPAAILAASWQLEAWNGHSEPCKQGIFTHPPVNIEGTDADVIARIAETCKTIVEYGNTPVMLGGEHTVSYGAIKGLLAAGVKDIGVVQIDAHADLREAYEGNPYSHASVMKRVLDENIPLFQLGVRALCREEISTRQHHNVQYLDACALVPNAVQEIQLPADFPQHVFFTLDIDGIDPSVFPSTGAPVPGGLGWYQTLSLFASVARQRQIIGFDIVEFAPIEGFHAYEFSAAQLCYNLMGILQQTEGIS